MKAATRTAASMDTAHGPLLTKRLPNMDGGSMKSLRTRSTMGLLKGCKIEEQKRGFGKIFKEN